MKHKTERQLIADAKKGKRSAVSHLIERYEREIFYYIYRMTGHTEDARDLTQEVFIKVFKGISGFNGKSSFRTWLYKIATNHTLNFLTRRLPSGSASLLKDLADPSPTSLAMVERADLQDLLLKAIENLPRQQKAIMTLRIQEEMTYAEIAVVMGCSVGNCKAAYHNAVAKLREIFNRETVLS